MDERPIVVVAGKIKLQKQLKESSEARKNDVKN